MMATHSGNWRSLQLFRSRKDSTSSVKKNSPQNNRVLEDMPPDKELEEKVLHARFEYLSTNLPPDDVAMEMNSRGLLTVKEHEEYLSMKRTHTSDSTKSEYLLHCLGKRKAGFLTLFCDILRGIKQASYLADDISEAYKQLQRGVTSGLKSRSLVSRSDPDLLSTKSTYYPHECTRCKALERQNKKLERQNRRLKQQQEAYQNILPFKPLAEVTQEQLAGAFRGCDTLKQLLPSMQEAVTQTACQLSAAKTSLKKMNDMFAHEAIRAIVRAQMPSADHSERESIVSEGGAITHVVDTDNQQAQLAQHTCMEGHQSETSQVKPTIKKQLSVGAKKQPQAAAGDLHSSDAELTRILKKRREKVEATSITH